MNYKGSDMKEYMYANLNISLFEALNRIDQNGLGLLLLVNDNFVLEGILTDGDVRKAILNGVSLDVPTKKVMNKDYLYGLSKDQYEDHISLLKRNKKTLLPIIDDYKKLVGLVQLYDQQFNKIDNTVVLMVGGLGSRLGKLTQITPKPMLTINNKPLLEIILEKFIKQGFHKFIFCINYKGSVIKKYFGDGKDWNVSIQYTEEKKRLGTAGALSLMQNDIQKPIIVMNGDILTNIEFPKMLQFHQDHQSVATMVVKEHIVQIPFGVIEYHGYRIQSIKEKPSHKHYINAGIYILNPECLKFIKVNTFYNMTSLFNRLLKEKKDVIVYPAYEHEQWIDIGNFETYQFAKEHYD